MAKGLQLLLTVPLTQGDKTTVTSSSIRVIVKWELLKDVVGDGRYEVTWLYHLDSYFSDRMILFVLVILCCGSFSGGAVRNLNVCGESSSQVDLV